MAETLNISAVTEKYSKLFRENVIEINNGSFSILNDLRVDAINKYQQIGIPSFKNEDYKYTRIDKILSKDLSLQIPQSNNSNELNENFSFINNSISIYFRNGKFIKVNNASKLPKGVILASLAEIAKNKSQLISNFVNKQTENSSDALVALNTAFAQDGLMLLIPEAVIIENPIRVINISDNTCSKLTTQRNIIIVEKEAKANIMLYEYAINNCNSVINQLTEIFADDKAIVDICTIQNQNNQSTSINSNFYELGKETDIHTSIITLNAGIIRNNLKVELKGEEAKVSMMGISVIDNQQHVDNFTSVIHNVPNCLSNQLYKNVVGGKAIGAFTGKIRVMPNAQKTNAFQRNNNVLLSEEASMHAKPQLIIDANDVKCSHGATVGQIDEDALFYMRARGIGEQEARKMLMNAFCNEVVQEIRNSEVRDEVAKLVENTLNT